MVETSGVRQEARWAKAAPPWLYALAVFASAGLVFLVEPMVARMVLPRLGGSSAVWNTSLAFFQAALLAGYAYAHGLQRLRSLKGQMAAHIAVLALAALTLPLRISEVFGPPSIDRPAYWLLGVPYALILGPFSGVVELVPVVGPFVAGAAAVLAALTVSMTLAAEALAVFVVFRLLQDYVINPRFIGGGVGVPPLVVLAAAAAVGLLLGPVAVVVATPLAAVGVTVFEIAVRGHEPWQGWRPRRRSCHG